MEISSGMIGANPSKARRRKFGVGSLLILLVMGVLFTAIGLAAYNATKINPVWKRVNGTVVGVSNENSGSSGTTYAPVVSYQVSGQAYKVTSNTSSSSYPATGGSKQIAYDPANPGHAKVVDGAGVQAFLLLFPVTGILLIVLAPVLFIRSLRRSKDINKLKQTGQKVQGILTDIQSTMNNSNQGGHNYRLAVSATGPGGQVQNYTSDWMSGIGGLAMADYRSNPIPIDVYLNPANPQDYYVDISEVPNLTPDRIAELIRSATHAQSLSPTNPPTQTPGFAPNPAQTVAPAAPVVPSNPSDQTPQQPLQQ